MSLPPKTKLLLWWTNLRWRKHHPPGTGTLTSSGRSISHLILLLPTDRLQFDFSRRFLLTLRNAIGPGRKIRIYLVGRAEVGNLFNLEDFDHFLLYSESDLNKWGYPLKEFQNHLNTIEGDAIFDLNQEFSPEALVVSTLIQAPLRIGFYSEFTERYYNILIRINDSDPLQAGIRELLQLLGIK